MRKLVLWGLAALFVLCRVFPLNKNKVVLLRRFPQWGSLGVLGDYLAQHTKLHVLRIAHWRKLSTVYHLATAGTIFLNDGFRPLAYFPISKKVQVIQLWHADGALKRWGASVGEPFAEAKRYTAVVCASQAIVPHWAEAFGVPEELVLPLGSPQADKMLATKKFHVKQSAGQSVLYAPSFRDDDPYSMNLLAQFDFEKFRKQFPQTQLYVRLHPKLHGTYTLPGWVTDATNEDLAQLLHGCDCLITDYSSIMVDAAALDFPVILYVHDYENYMKNERGFYVDLRAAPPGPLAETFDELLGLLSQQDNSAQLRQSFVKHHLGELNGSSCENITNALL